MAHRSLRGWLRLWFSLDEPVDRWAYVETGVILMVVKYGIDAFLVLLVAGQLWSPLDYLVPSLFMRTLKLGDAPAWLLVAMVLWTLPFLWIGVSMSLRRALDAGGSPWLAFLFFVPLVNYSLMGFLALLPSRSLETASRSSKPVTSGQRVAAVRALVVGVVAGIALVAVCTLVLRGYGAALFLGTPFLVGAISAFVLNRDEPRTMAITQWVVVLTVVLIGLGLLLFGVEGVICLAMALPLAFPIAAFGAVAGRAIARERPGTSLHAVAVVLVLPGLAAAERAGAPPQLREVVSAIEVTAPPAVVWQNVVSFSELTEPPWWFFRLGIAYPLRATIVGAGVGAIRRCEFSTGAFVEPITTWDEPRRLAFGVTSQPPPLTEWSPYRSLHPPHLDGYFRARGGEFRLIALPGGRTRLEGSTWYELDMAPVVYWTVWADVLVHAIHDRVLTHVKRLAEARWITVLSPARRGPAA
jgi:uncharacterized membrane protein YhaH (DUF805 family)